MKLMPKTIQIFLPSGDPRGIRIAEITTRIVQAIEVPRSLIPEFFKMRESKQVALYFLFGESEDGLTQRVYIGQTGDIQTRLTAHNKEKAFWQRAIVLISRTNSLTQTHALFLEWQSIKAAKAFGRYLVDENKNSGTKPHTPAPLEADCLEIFDTGRTLLATLGYPIFEPLNPDQTSNTKLYYCKRSGTNASGKYTSEGFVVLKGSKGRATISKGFEDHSFAKMRDALIKEGKLSVQNGVLAFLDDILFHSPSGASAVVCGAASNGWLEWKNENGETLDAMERGNAAAEGENIL